MGTDNGVEMSAQARAVHLQVQALAVCIGDQQHPPPVAARRLQKFYDVRVDRNQMVHFLLQQGDVHVQLASPVVEAVPVHGALDLPVALKKRLLGLIEGKTVALGVTHWHMNLPELVVKMKV